MELNLTGVYPMYVNGEEKGSLNVKKEGLMTVFEGSCELQTDIITRLAVSTGTGVVKLGVMMPGEGGLSFRKRYTRAELARLGLGRIESCMPIGEGEPVMVPEPRVTPTVEKEGMEIQTAAFIQTPPEEKPPAGIMEIPVVSVEEAGKWPEEPVEEEPAGEVMYPTCKSFGENDWILAEHFDAVFSDEDMQSACGSVSGALLKVEGEFTYLAIPSEPGEPFPLMQIFRMGSPLELEGRSYVIFKIKDGRISE